MGDYEGIAEKTLVLIKPDGVKRGISSEILARLEKTGLKVIALKLQEISRDFAAGHYPSEEDFKRTMGGKTLETYAKLGLDPVKEIGTDDTLKIGEMITNWNVDHLTSGPIVAVVLSGNHAVSVVRKFAGATMPADANPGTIRGDYSKDSSALANMQKRAVRNVMHASGTVEEAKAEISYWFKPEELVDYKRADEDIAFI